MILYSYMQYIKQYCYYKHSVCIQNVSCLDMNTTLEKSNDDLTRGSKKKHTLTCKGILKTLIVTFLMLTSIALLSIPIIIYYIKTPGSSVKTNVQLSLPNHLVNLQTCEGTVDIVS